MRTLPALASVALLAAAAAPLDAQRYTLTTSDIAVHNLAGTLVVTGTSSGDVEVEVTPRGRDADRLQVTSARDGDRQTLAVRAPGDRVVYPAMGRGSRSTIEVTDEGLFMDPDAPGRTRRVTLAGSGSGTEAWADVTVSVPPGRTIRLHLVAGSLEVRGVEGAVGVRTASASTELDDVRGPVELRTSSGGASISRVEGGLAARSSSGRLRVSEVSGEDVSLQTSSGGIEARDLAAGRQLALTASSGRITAERIAGSEMELRASSGSIRLDGARGERFSARTSSGRQILRGIDAREIELQASSGSVELDATGSLQTLAVSSSSGSVRASVPPAFGGEVEIRTGSGGIRVVVPLQIMESRRSRVTGRIGEGPGSIRIRTSSGSVRLTGS